MNLLDLPEETIENIFEYVQEDDLLQLQLINKAINLIIAGSVRIQYRLELFLAGLEDHRDDDPEPLGERLNKLRSWQSRWAHAGASTPQTIILPAWPGTTKKYCLYGGVFAMQNRGLINFIRLPSPSRSVSLRSWSTPHLGFEPIGNLAIDPDQDLLVLVERHGIEVLAVRILDMYGKQHPQSTIRSLFLHLTLPAGAPIGPVWTTIAGPNAAVLAVVDFCGDRHDSVWVFDWASGRTVLRLEGLGISNIVFIDKFHLATSSLDPRHRHSYCLGLHDLRQRSSHVLFELPPHSSPTLFNPALFCCSYPGPVSVFNGSPAHAVLIMVILERDNIQTTLVAIHPQSLCDLMEREDSYVRWKQWEDKAELLAAFWGSPEKELQITAGLRLITPLGWWHIYGKNPRLRLHTIQPWMSPRGDTTCRSVRIRTKELRFSIPGSSHNLMPLISEENILWIDSGSGDAVRLSIFSV